MSHETTNGEWNWDIIKSYYKKDHLLKLVTHQISSYNMFIEKQIKNTINMFNPVNISSEQYFNSELKKDRIEIKKKKKFRDKYI